MAKAELMEEPVASASTGPVDILIGLTGEVDPASLQVATAHAATAFDRTLPGVRIGIAYANLGDSKASTETDAGAENVAQNVQLFPYKFANAPTEGVPWLTSGAIYSSIFALASRNGSKASVVIGTDLAALEHGAVADLAAPILAGECELAMPIYAQSRYAGLLNASILAPLTRALYGKRVRYPLAQDFAVAPSLFSIFEHPGKRVQPGSETLFWPATEAAVREKKICQVYINAQHATVAGDVDLSTLLAQVVGPLFSDMETNAPVWQRVRGSHAVPVSGTPSAAVPENGHAQAPPDTRPMVESYLLALRNLQDVWSLVLPPVTQLELKRLDRLSIDQFRLPDALWVRILYDFALAHRLRTLSRSHLMGALTPLYLAWVASYAGEVVSMSDAEAEARLEQLATAFETGKPYLLSRWRWPDRFNP
jgi:glucosylglycerate synthase